MSDSVRVPRSAELEQFAKAVALAIRGGEKLSDEQWDGPTENDQELTKECRRIAISIWTANYPLAAMQATFSVINAVGIARWRG
jgi:hypothetical protein